MRFYENPNKTSENRLTPRSYYIPSNPGAYTLLNGTWRFRYFERDIDIEEEIIQWDEIDVPSCWQARGFENPNYSNVEYPYPVDPPYAPTDNPCGVYEREFEVKNTENRTYFVMEGVASTGSVYINGKYVGFTSGNHMQAEFDITDFVVKGQNTVRVEVRKWACTSYLEDQDYFRFNGIFRDVYLLSRPQGHIRDIDIRTRGNDILIKLDGSARITLMDNGKVLEVKEAAGEASFHVENPVLWNAEIPYLYELKFESMGEVITQKVGFRTIKISDKYEILINDVPVKLQGVNHHDTHPTNGWTMSDEDILTDLRLMKKLNINCIRTSHYPPTPKFLDFCDEMGFYVILEADLETHGYTCRDGGNESRPRFTDDALNWPCGLPIWEKEYVERMVRAVQRDKNHTSVVMWSTGNESGFGENHKAMIRYLRGLQDGRLVHCEDASYRAAKFDDSVRFHSDIYSRMYAPTEECKEYCQDPTMVQPLFLCEFCHAMGNGPGDIHDYWELVEEYPKFVGGCIWEWADHTVIENGIAKYGGDWPTDISHAENFCSDGMVMCDRSLKAGSYEVKQAYQPIRAKLEDGKIAIRNRLSFRNLKDYKLKYQLVCDGKTLWEEETVLDLPPQAVAYLDVPAGASAECAHGCYVNIQLLDETDYEAAAAQIMLEVPVKPVAKVSHLAQLRETKLEIYAEGENFRYTFSKHYGVFTQLEVGGKELLASPMHLTTFRAPIDNERKTKHMWIRNEFVYAENMNAQFDKIYDCRIENGIILVEGSLAGVSRTPVLRYTQKIAIGADGKIDFRVEATVRDNAPWIPRFGYEFSLQEADAGFTYFGMGPGETYIDLHNYAAFGLYSSKASDEYVPYIMPQEHGNHYGVSYLALENGLTFASDKRFECNVSQYSAKQLYETMHAAELQKDGKTYVRIDYKNSGVGSHSCGPDLLEQYRLKEKEIAFSFTLRI